MYRIIKNKGTDTEQSTGLEFYLDNAMNLARDSYNTESLKTNDTYTIENENGRTVKIIPSYKK